MKERVKGKDRNILPRMDESNKRSVYDRDCAVETSQRALSIGSSGLDTIGVQ